jgi:type I restriction enzyme S subunit
VPFVIPESWCWVEMSDIFLLNPKNDINDNVDGGFIPMACVCDGYSGEHTFITKQWGDIKKGFSHFQNGDIGIAKISPCFENRKSVIFSDLPNNIGSGTTELVVLRGIIVNTAFYLLLIKSDWYISEGTKYFKGVVGQQRVHKDIFTTLQVPMPPLREQQKIVDSVKKWFSAIDEIENGATELETVIKQVKSKILDLAVSGKLVPQDPNDEPAIELLKRINPAFEPCDNSHYENLPFEIPSTWVWVSHNDMLEISGGAQPPKSEFSEVMKPGYIRLYQIRDYGEKPIPIYIPLSTASKTTVKGDILLARYGGSLGKVFIAEDGAYNVAMAKVILCYPEVLNQKFVYYYYLSSIYQNKLRSISRTAQAGFNSGDFEDMYFPLPPLEEQGRIVDAISSIWEMIDMITAEL